MLHQMVAEHLEQSVNPSANCPFGINEPTDSHDWLFLLWLTRERHLHSRPPRQDNKFCFWNWDHAGIETSCSKGLLVDKWPAILGWRMLCPIGPQVSHRWVEVHSWICYCGGFIYLPSFPVWMRNRWMRKQMAGQFIFQCTVYTIPKLKGN